LPALDALLAAHPRVDVTLPTRQGATPLEVAAGEGASAAFLDGLQRATSRHTVQTLTSLARDGADWPSFYALLLAKGGGDVATNLAALNSVPAGRTWGVLHQVGAPWFGRAAAGLWERKKCDGFKL
jgi:hypothetical protein